MTNDRVYYFDVLPVRPQPKPLESLTSYLTRLAVANHLHSMTKLFNLCFPGERPKLTIANRDLPPTSFGNLSTISQCSESRLLATTFCHLGQKFDRPPKAYALGMFLSRSLACQLRYCPQCLADYGYYRLTWRFLYVEGCVEHSCRLLNRCGHCGQPLPFLSYSLQLGICPACGEDLRTCSTSRIAGQQLESVKMRTRDFEYLLQPQPYETDPDRQTPLIQLIGRQLAGRRKIQGLTIAAVARQLKQYPPLFSYLENGKRTRGLSFHQYLIYINFLKVALRDFFEGLYFSFPPEQSYEDKALYKIQQAVTTLEQQGQAVTQTKVKQITGVRMAVFTRYPKIKAFWAEYKAGARQQWEADMIQRVHQAANTLRKQGKCPTKTAISRMVGQDPNNLRYCYPSVWAVVAGYCENKMQKRPQSTGMHSSAGQRKRYRREPELLRKVEQAVVRLQQEGKQVSQYAIANLVGMSTDGLNYYPRVRAILQANKGEPRRQDETVLLEQVRNVVTHLESTDARVSGVAVARLVGLSVCTLNYYPRVKTFLTEQTAKYQDRRAEQRRQLEKELLLKVPQIAELLTIKGTRVTWKAIAEILEMPISRLNQFPRVKLLLQQPSRRSRPD